jgi:hypothetical protein
MKSTDMQNPQCRTQGHASFVMRMCTLMVKGHPTPGTRAASARRSLTFLRALRRTLSRLSKMSRKAEEKVHSHVGGGDLALCLYVDNSNIFIEATRLAPLMNGGNQGLRYWVRIEYEKLVELCTAGRPLQRAVVVPLHTSGSDWGTVGWKSRCTQGALGWGSSRSQTCI